MPNENIPIAWLDFSMTKDGKIQGGFNCLSGATSIELIKFYRSVMDIIGTQAKQEAKNWLRHFKLSDLFKRRA